ncbi:reverse transcriptase-like protein [Silvibacterium sp.]|uniref:reverse transcriptase-like protein n=1 Tax=Silvibacterium sp. TaxID=1964179 RepID=UPI0039E348FF
MKEAAAGKSEGSSRLVTAYCDGGSRGNPGPSGYGVYIEGETGEMVAELSEYLGKRTNNFAEYSGLLAALDFAVREGHSRMRVVADSELMVKQIQGKYRVNSPDLKPLYEEAKRRIARLDFFEIRHVLRNKNKEADRLANEAMDRGQGRTVNVAAQTTSATRSSAPRPTAPSAPRPVAADAVMPEPEARVRPASGSGGIVVAPIRAGGPAQPAPEAPKTFRGLVKGGVIHLVEGNLPDGIFVRITPERR